MARYSMPWYICSGSKVWGQCQTQRPDPSMAKHAGLSPDTCQHSSIVLAVWKAKWSMQTCEDASLANCKVERVQSSSVTNRCSRIAALSRPNSL